MMENSVKASSMGQPTAYATTSQLDEADKDPL
jgi:hypothetical protein